MARTRKPPQGQSPRFLSGKRALVVDGDESERELLRQSLSGWGVAVECTANPLQGLALLWDSLQLGQQFHLTVFGPAGHGVSGDRFAALVRSEPRLTAMPMLFVGYGKGVGGATTLRRQGFFDAVETPIDKTLLFDAVHRACGAPTAPAGVVRIMDRHAAVGPSIPRLDVLVVEPSPEQRRLLRAALARGGHQIFEVRSGEQAVEALTKHRFDVVLLALDLPGFGSADTLKLLTYTTARDDWPALIGVARDPTAAEIRDFVSLGIDVVVYRPVQPHTLLDAIAAVARNTAEHAAHVTSAPSLAHVPTDGTYLDERVLKQIERIGPDKYFLSDLIREFLADVGGLLDGVLEARGTAQCFPRLREFGYVLQDNAGSLGAVQLYQLGLTASRCPEEHFQETGDELVSRIEVAYRHTQAAFTRYLRRSQQSRSPS